MSLASEFPDDDSGYGFDNIADVLSTSPLHLEMLESATDQILQTEFLAAPVVVQELFAAADGPDVTATVGGACCGGWNLWSNGSVDYAVTLENEGSYRFSVRAYGQQAGPDLVQMVMSVDGVAVETFEVAADSESTFEVFTVQRELSAGAHQFSVSFINDYYEPDLGLDSNLIVAWLAVSGPEGATGEPPANAGRLFTCDPAVIGEVACARQIAGEFGKKAWRRPIEPSEVDGLMTLYEASRDSGGDWEEGVGLIAKGIMLSPHFWYRVEIDAEPESTVPHPISSWELASRLSYFLWSSMPDDELFALAEDGSLVEDDVLEAQVRRMLADSRASALVDNLAGQWLHVRAVADAFPDVWVFPEWDETLRASMQEEMRRMATRVMLGDRSMLELLTAEETEIDARLARHYGLPEPAAGFESVSIADTERMGWLTTGGLLTATSYPGRTSPVKRGKWVLSNLMCEAPAPPPGNVDAFLDTGQALDGESLTEQLERHRADPICASCHQSMDPIGLGLENFDGVGMWRNTDELGNVIDSSGELPDGFAFHSARELSAYLASDPRFQRCVVIKTMTYGLGRAPTVQDWPYLQDIESSFSASGHRFADLAVAIALSPAFRERRGESEEVSP